MKLLLLAFLCLQDVDDAIKTLGDSDIAVRDEAARKLVAAGEPALPKLREALKTADGEAKAQLQAIIDKIDRAAVLKKIKIEIELPKEAPTLKQVQGAFQFTVKITNDNNEDVVLWPYLSLKVTDKEGKEPKRTRWLGRWGDREKQCFLECVPFWTIKSHATMELKDGITAFQHDPQAIAGWRIDAAGDYTIALTTSFKRADFKARCKKCENDHGDAKWSWNKAVELERTVEAKLTVKE